MLSIMVCSKILFGKLFIQNYPEVESKLIVESEYKFAPVELYIL